MKQFIEVELQTDYRSKSVKFVFNVNQIINVGETTMITTAINPVAHGTGQVIYKLGREEATRVKKILLETEN